MTTEVSGFQVASTAICDMTTGASAPQVASSVMALFENNGKIPIHLKVGKVNVGSIAERVAFKSVEFHSSDSSGTARIRVWIDGRYTCDGTVTMSEGYNRHRKVNIPVGKQVGYNIDIEVAGIFNLQSIEVNYEPMDDRS